MATEALQEELGRAAIASCALALALVVFGCWSLNIHLFPLYDMHGSFIREVATAVKGLMLVAVAFVSVRWPQLVGARLFSGGAIALTIAGSLLVVAGDQASSMALLVTGACLVSVAEGACWLAVGLALCVLPVGVTAACITGAVLVAQVGQLVCPTGYSAPALVLHGACMVAAVLVVGPWDRETLRRFARSGPARDVSITEPFSMLPFGHQLFLCLFLFCMVRGFMLTFGEIDGAPQASAWSVVVLLAVCVVLRVRPSWVDPDTLTRAMLLLAIAGLLLVPTAGLVPFVVPNGLLGGSIAVFDVFQWLVLASLARRSARSSVAVFAWGYALRSAGVIVGANLGRAVNHFAESVPAAASLAVAVAVFSLMVFMVVVLSRFSFEKTVEAVHEAAPPAPPAAALPGEPSLEARCDALAAARGLTRRETEVMRLLARGRTGVFIQKELCVSYNTIKAHVKHIYQKLDVHTHQELIDLVEHQTL